MVLQTLMDTAFLDVASELNFLRVEQV
jgi:hypothetical protein